MSLKGLYPRLADVAGVSTLHALLLAVRLVHSLLKGKLDEGVRRAFFDPEHPDECNEPFVPDDFFGA